MNKLTYFIATISILLAFSTNSQAITTASKTAEDSFKTPAAVYVINRTDIRRSGATSIPEVLRTVPGLQVAQGEAGQWVVTSRGFANGFANKLLVMVDGRTIYTPLFSGVHWGGLNIMLENIKQIEIIRGPGATQWGANAVNGVINIITEPAINTQKGLASISVGNNFDSQSARYGGKIKDNSYYRVYAENKNEYNVKNVDQVKANNNSSMSRGGFRIDYDEFEKDQITLQSDIYNGDDGLDLYLPKTGSQPIRLQGNQDTYGGNILSKWQRKINDNEESELQFYYDRSTRDWSLLSRRTQTFDLDFQYSRNFNKRHKLTTGVGYREVHSNLKGTNFRIYFNPTKRNTKLYNAFVQDKIRLFDNKLHLTIGSKFEHNDFTGSEYQPNIKASWLINNDQTLWFSISKATRTPNISENDIKMVVGTFDATNYTRQKGDTNFDSEKLISYEAGYRIRPTNNSSIDLATFYNHYNNLRSAEPDTSDLRFVDVFPQNNGEGSAFGFELDTKLKLNKWELKAAYSYLKLDLDTKAGSGDQELEREQKRSPRHQFNFLSKFNVTDKLEFDNNLYYVDRIFVTDNNSNKLRIPSYLRFDSRIGYKVNNNLSLDLIGQNLFDSNHLEFSGALWSKPIEVGRTIYAKATIKF